MHIKTMNVSPCPFNCFIISLNESNVLQMHNLYTRDAFLCCLSLSLSFRYIHAQCENYWARRRCTGMWIKGQSGTNTVSQPTNQRTNEHFVLRQKHACLQSEREQQKKSEETRHASPRVRRHYLSINVSTEVHFIFVVFLCAMCIHCMRLWA